MKGYTRVEDGVGLSTKYLNMVTKVDQSFGEVTGIDALTSYVGLSTVGEVCDPQRAMGVGRRFHRRLMLPPGRWTQPEVRIRPLR